MNNYFSRKRNFYHGIMFHHFHDNKKHIKSQGSISKSNFIKILNHIGKKNILDANLFLIKLKDKTLKKNHVCLTFDDGLKSQFDIIFPILEKLKIKAFFFIYSSIFDNKPDPLEIFRYFRMSHFKNIDYFYKFFFKYCFEKRNIDISKVYKLEKKEIKKRRKIFPFYSSDDILFRLLRDKYLKKEEYHKIMFELMKLKKFNYKKIIKKLYINKKNLKEMSKKNHIIGLHSHSHPTKFENLSYNSQIKELKKNKRILFSHTKKNIKSMSHPCGSYNLNTIKILKKMEIELGFRSSLGISKSGKINNSNLEIAREDHANILRSL